MKGKLKFKPVESARGGTSGTAYLIALSSLPPEAQREYLQLQQSRLRPEQEPESNDSAPSPDFSLDEYVEMFGQEAIDEALKKQRIVEKALSYEYKPGKTKLRKDLAEKNDIGPKTLYRWMEQYKEDKLMGLLRKDSDSKRKRRSMDEVAIDYLKSLYLKPIRPTVQWAYDRLVEKAHEEGWKIGSRPTCYRIIGEISESEKVMGREGIEAWNKQCMPKATRDTSDLKRNEIWIGDHHEFDFFIEHAGRVVRPWLTAWQDMAARPIVGWCITVQPNSESIAVALRNGILPNVDPEVPFQGLPLEVYIDNGKDYRSHRLSGGTKTNRVDYSTEMRGVFANLDITPRYCTPYSPWAKNIERFFGTVADQFSRFQPGWCGRNPKERPETLDVKALLKAGKLLPLEQLVDKFAEYLKQHHSAIHRGIKDTPINLYQNLEPIRQGLPDYRALDVLLMRSTNVKIFPDGIHRFNHIFWADEIMPLVGDTVTVRFDPNNIGELLVYYKGRMICVATNKKLLSMRATEDDLKKHRALQAGERKRIKQKIASYGRDNTLEAVVAENHKGGSKTITTEVQSKNPNKVTHLTGFEKAGRRPQTTEEPPAKKPGDMARKFLQDAGRKFYENC
jgi:putative transposase